MECRVCFSQYSSKVQPRLLKECAHSLCQDCLIKLLKNKKIECPFCRKSYKSRNLDKYPKNTELLSLVNQFSQETHNSQIPFSTNSSQAITPKQEYCDSYSQSYLSPVKVKSMDNITYTQSTCYSSQLSHTQCTEESSNRSESKQRIIQNEPAERRLPEIEPYQPVKPNNTRVIKHLALYQNCKVEGIIKTKSQMMSSRKNDIDKNYFKITIMDQNQETVECVFYEAIADKYFNQLYQNSYYYFSGGYVKLANEQYNKCTSKYSIIFGNYSRNSISITKMQQGFNVGDDYFISKRLKSLQQIYNFCQVDDIVDFVGKVVFYSELTTKQTKNGEKEHLDITLKDHTSNRKIIFTLWDKNARSFYKSQPEFFYLEYVKVTEWSGIKGLSLTGKSNITVNEKLFPRNESVKQFFDWVKNSDSEDYDSVKECKRANFKSSEKESQPWKEDVKEYPAKKLIFDSPEKSKSAILEEKSKSEHKQKIESMFSELNNLVTKLSQQITKEKKTKIIQESEPESDQDSQSDLESCLSSDSEENGFCTQSTQDTLKGISQKIKKIVCEEEEEKECVKEVKKTSTKTAKKTSTKTAKKNEKATIQEKKPQSNVTTNLIAVQNFSLKEIDTRQIQFYDVCMTCSRRVRENKKSGWYCKFCEESLLCVKVNYYVKVKLSNDKHSFWANAIGNEAEVFMNNTSGIVMESIHKRGDEDKLKEILKASIGQQFKAKIKFIISSKNGTISQKQQWHEADVQDVEKIETMASVVKSRVRKQKVFDS